LQAIATARRLGAVVEGYDVRAAAGEQVKSLGATFLEVDLGGIKTEDAGGYAVELSEEAMNRGRALIAEHAKTADVIITTAQVPGRRAPLLLLKEAVDGMKRGSIVIDLAGRPAATARSARRTKRRTRWRNDHGADKSCRRLCRSTRASSTRATSPRF
jgi:NAD(P) transhydrogenase subunit alpha